MIDLVIYNDRTAFAPSVLRSGVQVGGFEVACEQIARGIAATGRGVVVFSNGPEGEERGVFYRDIKQGTWKPLNAACRAILTARACPIPSWIEAKRTFTTCVDDPRGDGASFDHLKGRTTIVALSEWQAGLYRELGHERVIVIPSMLEDDYSHYARCEKAPRRFVCVNAWNKGTPQTLHMWAKMRRRLRGCTLAVGSPYSHPADAADYCAFAGVQWLGTLSPVAIADTLSTAEAVFRVCVAPETFGVADAIAEVVGTRVHCLCTNGVGAARDVLNSPYIHTDPVAFEHDVISALGSGPVVPKADYSVSTVIKKWEEVLFG